MKLKQALSKIVFNVTLIISMVCSTQAQINTRTEQQVYTFDCDDVVSMREELNVTDILKYLLIILCCPIVVNNTC